MTDSTQIPAEQHRQPYPNAGKLGLYHLVIPEPEPWQARPAIVLKNEGELTLTRTL
ncbi:hypothetical protein KSZ_74170 [Dictyobacter formicarum]|uniref:Uncharacterized protein n=1 Tax=Dictyobacter formicarum TaxID=2778368 RepID=A0ABQ3VVS5_9CHLR|nr:hypothetical protein KSZ_74170 [Dictyobacter formicarum]